LTISKKRGYKDPLEATLETAKMDRAIFDTLMDVMNESLPVFRRYLKIKAEFSDMVIVCLGMIFLPL